MMIHTAQRAGPPAHGPVICFSSEQVPDALVERAQWVVWRYEQRVEQGKLNKVPYQAGTGQRASCSDATTWSTFEQAVATYEASNDRCAGVMFAFSNDDPFTGVDLDDCIHSDGTLAPEAEVIVRELDSYTEISPSGTGVKIFLCGAMPDGRHRTKQVGGFGEIEVYSDSRFFTVTGRRLDITPAGINARQEQLDALCARLLPPRTQVNVAPPLRLTTDSPDDDELIDRAQNAKNGGRFQQLWSGHTSAYGGDDSAADQALCNHLAFWTGRDAEQMDRIFRRSGLMRSKWDEKRGTTTYGSMTIRNAISQCTDTYQPQSNMPKHRQRRPLLSSSGRPGVDEPGQTVPLGERDPETGRIVLSQKRTLPTAESFMREFCQNTEGRTLLHYAGEFLEWRDNRYGAIEDEALRSRLHPWLHNALRYVYEKHSGDWKLINFDANPTTVNHALASVATSTHVPISVEPPVWLDADADRPSPLELLPCKSFNLHLSTRNVMPATPAFFNRNALDFDFDPEPDVPERWMKFLEQLWGDDLESVALLQEWFGYCLTADTSQQKMLLIVGPMRSGKGTIARVQRHLVGTANVVAPTTGGLAGNFGLQPLIGKSLAIVSDARFSGKTVGTLIERLLCISGEDALTIDRKYLGAVTTKLPTRFMFLTNELPRLKDASAALANRFLVLRLTESFLGQEDLTLTDQLLEELPGILLWAVEGWKRLRERGRFIQPSSSEDAIRDLEELASPVKAFIRERCEVGHGLRERVGDLYKAWTTWCEHAGCEHVTTKQSFGRDLNAAYPGITRRRGTEQVSFYEGIQLR